MLMTCCAYSCTQYALHTQYMLLTHADVLLYLQLHTVRSAYTVHASDPCCWLVWPTVQYISAVFSYLSYKEDPLALFLIVLKSRTNENVYKPEEVNSSAKLLSRKYSCKELLYVPNICIAASYKCIHTYICIFVGKNWNNIFVIFIGTLDNIYVNSSMPRGSPKHVLLTSGWETLQFGLEFFPTF